jgi:uncharacterized membrane protein YqgA involved in biofilm formation
VVASLVFCVGPLTVLGALEEGLRGDFQLLAIKSMLDGFSALAFSSGLGIGVGWSALTVLIVQGGITLGARMLESVMSEVAVSAMTAAGGLLIIGIALHLLKVREVRTANLLPALIIAPVITVILS